MDPAADAGLTSPLRVLLIDDGAHRVNLIGDELTRQGHMVVGVLDSALLIHDCVLRLQPDVVIVDSESPNRYTLTNQLVSGALHGEPGSLGEEKGCLNLPPPAQGDTIDDTPASADAVSTAPSHGEYSFADALNVVCIQLVSGFVRGESTWFQTLPGCRRCLHFFAPKIFGVARSIHVPC